MNVQGSGMRRFRGAVAAAVFLALSSAGGAAEDIAYEPMKAFAPYAGKTWRGTGKDAQGKDVVDVAHWEFILGGRALQTTHRIEGDTYGGRTIIFYDEGAKKHVYHYFTTGGYHTQGDIVIDGEQIDAFEDVKGHPTITKVKGSFRIDGDKLVSESEYLDAGKWVAGHSFVYSEAPGAEVGY